MSKGNETVLVGVTVSLGLLLLVGAGVGSYLLIKKAAPGPVADPAVQQQASGLVVGNGVVATVGSGGAGWTAQQAAAAEKAREEAWRKTDKINQLDRDLANAQNEIKRLTDQLNVIDATPMPAEIITRWSMQHQTDCRNSRPVISKWSCNATDLTDGYDKKAQADWDTQRQTQKRPILTRLSELNNTQLSIISNLAALGVNKQPVNARNT